MWHDQNVTEYAKILSYSYFKIAFTHARSREKVGLFRAFLSHLRPILTRWNQNQDVSISSIILIGTGRNKFFRAGNGMSKRADSSTAPTIFVDRQCV
jgi:hypothetical protein